MVFKDIETTKKMCNTERVGNTGVWKEVDLPKISELNQADDDQELNDVVSGAHIGETQQQKSIMANSDPCEEEVIVQEERYERVEHIPTTMNQEPILTEGFLARKEEDTFCETCNVI